MVKRGPIHAKVAAVGVGGLIGVDVLELLREGGVHPTPHQGELIVLTVSWLCGWIKTSIEH